MLRSNPRPRVFGGSRVFGNFGKRQAGARQGICRTTGAQSTVAQFNEAACEFDDAGFVRYADQCQPLR